jgi:hypothetical protein
MVEADAARFLAQSSASASSSSLPSTAHLSGHAAMEVLRDRFSGAPSGDASTDSEDDGGAKRTRPQNLPEANRTRGFQRVPLPGEPGSTVDAAAEDLSGEEVRAVVRRRQRRAACKKEEEDPLKDFRDAAIRILENPSGLVATDTAIAQLLKVTPGLMQRCLLVGANVTVRIDASESTNQLEVITSLVASEQLTVVAQLKATRWDETPTPARVEGVDGTCAQMRVQVVWALLLEINAGPCAGEFAILQAELPTWLTALENKTARCVCSAIQRVTDAYRKAFRRFFIKVLQIQRKLRPDLTPLQLLLHLSDSESANRMLSHNIWLMGIGLVAMFGCNLHFDVSGLQKCLPLRPGFQRHLCQFANSLSLVGGALRVRYVLEQLIARKMVVSFHTSPDPLHVEFAEQNRELGWPRTTSANVERRGIMEDPSCFCVCHQISQCVSERLV